MTQTAIIFVPESSRVSTAFDVLGYAERTLRNHGLHRPKAATVIRQLLPTGDGLSIRLVVRGPDAKLADATSLIQHYLQGYTGVYMRVVDGDVTQMPINGAAVVEILS